MALLVKQGTFTKTNAAPPVSQSITGVGFQPRALILWCSKLTSPFGNNLEFGLGFSDGTRSYTAAGFSLDAFFTPILFRIHRRQALALLGYNCDLTSFDADGFTLNWIENDLTLDQIHYLALGGDDLTGVHVDTFFDPVLGNGSVTGVGFQPDALLFTGIMNGVALPDTVADRLNLNLGMATATQQGAWSVSMERNNFNNTRRQRTDRAIAALDQLLPAGDATLVSMDADGFTLNWDCCSGQFFWGYLALKGGRYANGAETQPTSPGLKATTGVGFEPLGLLLSSFNRTATTAIVDHMRLSLGAASESDEGSAWGGHTDLSNPTEAKKAFTTTKALQLIEAVAGQPVDAEADASFDDDGYTLDWTTADAVQRQFLHLAIGQQPAPGPEPAGVVGEMGVNLVRTPPRAVGYC